MEMGVAIIVCLVYSISLPPDSDAVASKCSAHSRMRHVKSLTSAQRIQRVRVLTCCIYMRITSPSKEEKSEYSAEYFIAIQNGEVMMT